MIGEFISDLSQLHRNPHLDGVEMVNDQLVAVLVSIKGVRCRLADRRDPHDRPAGYAGLRDEHYEKDYGRDLLVAVFRPLAPPRRVDT